MKREYRVVYGVLLLAIGLYTDIAARDPFIKLFPLVRKLSKVGSEIRQDWYVLLGRNTGKKYEYDYQKKQFLYKKGLFSELVMTPYDIKGGLLSRNPNIEPEDLFKMLSVVTKQTYRNLDVFEKTMATTPSTRVERDVVCFLLLNYDYPLEDLNEYAISVYKDAYLWINAATLSAMKPEEAKRKGIQEDTLQLFQANWLKAYSELTKKLRF